MRKQNQTTTRRRRGAVSLLPAALAVALVTPLLSGCDVTGVEDIDVTTPGNFQSAEALPSIRAAAVGDFAWAFGGANGNSVDGQVSDSGLLTDEFIHSGTFPTRQLIDRRNILDTNATAATNFRNLQRARVTAENAAASFAELGPDQLGYPEVLSLAGYTYIFFAENYCSGVPFSEQTESGDFVYGEPQSTQAILQRALAKFDSALTAAQGVSADEDAVAEIVNLATVGKARTLLDLGRVDEAAAVAADVPTDFAYLVEYSTNTSREYNGVYELNNIEFRFSEADTEGVNGLAFPHDPRSPGESFDAATTAFNDNFGLPLVWAQQKYESRDADIPLATGVEARLIEAEADLRTGDYGGEFTILNDLRADVGLEPLPVATDEDAARMALFDERGYWFWATSHRLGDLRREMRQYGVPADELFPIGTYANGGSYGTDVSFPVPIDEQNNPNFTTCDNSPAGEQQF